MERLTSAENIASPSIVRAPSAAETVRRLSPLRGHVLFAVLTFALLAFAAHVRIGVQNLEIALDRNDRAQRAAMVLNERLQLELQTRRRQQAVQQYAGAVQASANVPVVRVAGVR